MKLIIFDNDMTIVNSSDAITAGMNAVAARYGLVPVSKEEVLKGIALPLADSFAQLWGRYDPAWTDHYRESVYKIEYELMKPFPDTIETLVKLKEMGLQLAVASNRFNPTEALQKMNLLRYFDDVVGLIDRVKPKPEPDMLALLMERLEATVEETLYVGDALIDIQTAHAANVKSVGVTTGNYTREDFEKARAWRVIDRLGDIFTCL